MPPCSPCASTSASALKQDLEIAWDEPGIDADGNKIPSIRELDNIAYHAAEDVRKKLLEQNKPLTDANVKHVEFVAELNVEMAIEGDDLIECLFLRIKELEDENSILSIQIFDMMGRQPRGRSRPEEGQAVRADRVRGIHQRARLQSRRREVGHALFHEERGVGPDGPSRHQGVPQKVLISGMDSVTFRIT